jgi:hypothetical protein
VNRLWAWYGYETNGVTTVAAAFSKVFWLPDQMDGGVMTVAMDGQASAVHHCKLGWGLDYDIYPGSACKYVIQARHYQYIVDQ